MASDKSNAREAHRNSFRSDFLGPGSMGGSLGSQPWANARTDSEVDKAHTIFEKAIVKDNARAIFGNIYENQTTHITQPPEAPLVLRQALYRSKSNEDQDYCYDGTRRDILKQLLSRISAPGDGDVVWVVGPAGFGKSAIAKTLCRSLDVYMQGNESAESSFGRFQLGASYFFRRIDTERSDVNKMIITIAQQLAENIIGFQSRFGKYTSNVKEIVEKNSDDLFRDLIVEPLLHMSGSRVVIVVDALDECVTSSESVVRLLTQLRDLTSVCVRLVFTSRPTPMLGVLSSDFRFRPGLTVNLDDNDVIKDSHSDILIFLRQKFREIHLSSDSSKHNQEWPSEGDFQGAVRLATSPKPLFIYAVTMCRFIGDGYADPQDRLQQWLEANSDDSPSGTIISTEANQQLSSLYRTFFQEVGKRKLSDEEFDRLKTVLHAVYIVKDDLPALSLFRLLGCAEFDRELSFLRRNMQPILDIPQDSELAESPLRIYHRSLLDFLKYAKPEGCIFYPFNQSLSGLALGEKALALMSSLLCQLQRGYQPDRCDEKAALFAFRNWASFLCDYDGQIPDRSGIIDKFLTYHFLASFRFGDLDIEETSEMEELMLDSLEHLCENQQSPALKSLFENAVSFIETMMNTGYYFRLKDAYESALVFCPTSSFLARSGQVWGDPVTRFQTYSLRHPDTLRAPRPVSFHFSKGADVFVALFSDNTIRRWNRNPGGVELGWDLQSIFCPSLDLPKPSSQYSKLTTLSANGDLVAYSTATGVEIWNTESGRNRHIRHPPGSQIKSMSLSEDGSRLAICYESTKSKDAAGQLWVWSITNICNPRRRRSYLSKALELLRSGRETTMQILPSFARFWPSHCVACTIDNAGDQLAGISFSPDGDQLAVLSFSVKETDSGRQTFTTAQSWNTNTWESKLYHSTRTDSFYGDGREVLNVTMATEDDMAILWETSEYSGVSYEIESWNLSGGYEKHTAGVPVGGNGYAKMVPEPFWIDGLTAHMSQSYLELDEDLEIVHHLCSEADCPDANTPDCISENDEQRMLLPTTYVNGLSACGKDMFVFSSVKNGDLKFVDFSHKDQDDHLSRETTGDRTDGSLEGHSGAEGRKQQNSQAGEAEEVEESNRDDRI